MLLLQLRCFLMASHAVWTMIHMGMSFLRLRMYWNLPLLLLCLLKVSHKLLLYKVNIRFYVHLFLKLLPWLLCLLTASHEHRTSHHMGLIRILVLYYRTFSLLRLPTANRELRMSWRLVVMLPLAVEIRLLLLEFLEALVPLVRGPLLRFLPPRRLRSPSIARRPSRTCASICLSRWRVSSP